MWLSIARLNPVTIQPPMLWKVIRRLIKDQVFLVREAICEWIYVRKVLVRQWPIFMIASALWPESHRAMAPDAHRELEPIRNRL